MIRLELELTDVDFDALVELYLPQLADKFKREGNPLGTLMNPAMVKTLLRGMSAAKKEQLASDLINNNSARIAELFESAAAQKGVKFRIVSAQAQKI